MHDELIKLKAQKQEHLTGTNLQELKNLKEKVLFFQDENMRLSHDLSNSQKKYDIMKNQLKDLENEKSKISIKISELTSSLGQSNLIKSPFKENQKIKNFPIDKKESKSDLDINTQIKNIFKT